MGVEFSSLHVKQRPVIYKDPAVIPRIPNSALPRFWDCRPEETRRKKFGGLAVNKTFFAVLPAATLASAALLLPGSVAQASRTNPYIKSVSLFRAPRFDQFIASAVKANPGVHVELAFRVQTPSGQWKMIQSYRHPSDNVLTRPNPPHPGTWRIEALALTHYQVAHKEWNLAVISRPEVMFYDPRENSAFKSVSRSVQDDQLFMQATTKKPWVHVEYQYLLKTPGKPWRIAQRYSPSSQFAYVPPAGSTGLYEIQGMALTQYQVAHKEWSHAVATAPLVLYPAPKRLKVGIDYSHLYPLTTTTPAPMGVSASIQAPDGGSISKPETITLTSSNPRIVSVPRYESTDSRGDNANFEIHAGSVPGQATITARCGSAKTSITITVVPLQPNVFFAPTAATVTGKYHYSWAVSVTDQFGRYTLVTSAAVVDKTADPEVTYSPAHKNLRIVRVIPGAPTNIIQYTITATSPTPIPASHKAAITIDGRTYDGTF